MAEADKIPSAVRDFFERAFRSIAEAMKPAAKEENYRLASAEAERYGLTEKPANKPIGTAWEKTDQGLTLWFQWRYYDQSRPFSIQKDMNIMSLQLRQGSEILLQAEERYED